MMRIALLLGILALAALTLLNTPLLPPTSAHGQMLLLLAGVVGVVWGLARRGGAVTAQGVRQARLRSLLAVALVLLLAAALRLWQLGDAVHFFTDELSHVDAISTLRDSGAVQLLTPFHYIASFPWVYPYLQLGAVSLFGPELLAVRIISAAFGVLGVAAVMALARELPHPPTPVTRENKTIRDRGGGSETLSYSGGGSGEPDSAPQGAAIRRDQRAQVQALLAGLALAVFPPHLHFSRSGMNNIADPLFGTLALVFLLRARRTGRRSDWALAGAALGLTQYFYEGGRLLYPALVVLWLVGTWGAGMLTRWRAPAARAHNGQALSLQGWLRFWTAFVLLAAPVYLTLLTQGDSLATRFDRRGVGGNGYWHELEPGIPDFVRGHLLPPLLHLLVTPDGSRFFYDGETALILPWLVPLFLLGAWTAARWVWGRAPGTAPHPGDMAGRPYRRDIYRQGWLLVLLWLALTLLGNVLIDDSDWTPRFIVGFPAIALLLALGAQRAWAGFVRWRERHPPFAGTRYTVSVVVALLLFVVPQGVYYFGPHLARYNVQVRLPRDHQDAAFRARGFPPGTQIHIITDELYIPGDVRLVEIQLDAMWRFWGLDRIMPPFMILEPQAFTDEYLAALPRGVDHAFFFEPDDIAVYNRVIAQFATRPPAFSPFASVPVVKQYGLVYAPAVLDGSELPPTGGG